MGSSQLIAILLAAVAGMLVAGWAYWRLEEPVRGRAGPGVLRGVSLFLILAGWFLPELPIDAPGSGITHAIIVDHSLSMSLPATVGGSSRTDSVTTLVGRLASDFTIEFGDSARVAGEEGRQSTGNGGSAVVPALELARAGGADSVTVLTDGELDDREEARDVARRLGLAVHEVRVSDSTRRLSISRVDAPASAEAGDSIRLVIEVGSVGSEPGPDSVSLSVGMSDGTRVIVDFRAPDPGRTVRVPVLVTTLMSGSGLAAWQAFEVELAPEADPIGPPIQHRTWVEVVPTAAGGVIVSLDPDWEPHYLLPVLNRSVAGGARAWLRLGEDQWVRSGTDRMIVADDSRVRRDASRAQLLVVQAPPTGLPSWLVAVIERHPRVLFLARGSGSVPGTRIRIGPRQTGEWYVGGSPPASPIAGFLQATDYPALPPASALYALTGFDWSPLEIRRNRSGAPLPPIGVQRLGSRRRAVVAVEGMWRWASRAGPSRQAYRAVFAGLASWLLEAPDRSPVLLESTRLLADEQIRWRVASEVRDLILVLRDSTGAIVWSDSLSQPDSLVVGPGASSGSNRYEARGIVGGESFRTGRPFEVVGSERELGARQLGPLLEGAGTGTNSLSTGADRPIWPFVLAALLFCAEWFWRRRIGLR